MQQLPPAAAVLAEFGMRCDGCAVAPTESLAAGAIAHGLRVEPIVAALTQARSSFGRIPTIMNADREPNRSARRVLPKAVIAVMSGAEARFVHDPRAGSAMWQRIEVTHMPDAHPRKSLGVRSAWQQRDDVSHLKALIEQPVLPANPAEALLAAVGGATSDPAERLTAWLLDQSTPVGVP